MSGASKRCPSFFTTAASSERKACEIARDYPRLHEITPRRRAPRGRPDKDRSGSPHLLLHGGELGAGGLEKKDMPVRPRVLLRSGELERKAWSSVEMYASSISMSSSTFA